MIDIDDWWKYALIFPALWFLTSLPYGIGPLLALAFVIIMICASGFRR